MLKNISKTFLLLLASFCIFTLLNPAKVEAAKFVSEDYTLKREEILHDDLYVTGEIVEINGIVDGDVYIAADTVSITGTISDDLYIAGNTVTVSGNVYGDLVSFGSAVNVTGSVGESSYLIGGTIINTGSVVDDLVVIGGTITTEGLVDEDLIALGGNVTVKSTITEDLLAFGAALSLSDASVSGDIYQERGNFSTKDMDFFSNPNMSWWMVVSTALVSGISVFLVGVFLIYIMPVKTLNIVKKATSTGEEFIKSFATGFVILFIASIPTLALLSLTVVGIPLAGILLSLLVFLSIYARIWVEIGIGNMILQSAGKKKYSICLALLVGRCVSVLVGLIPIVGTIYSVIISLVGVGAFCRMKYDLLAPTIKRVSAKKTKK